MRRGWDGPAAVLDGAATAKKIKDEVAAEVTRLAAAGLRPGLGTILVGDDPGSRTYVAGKHRDCDEVGIASLRVDLPATATQQQVEDAVAQLNADPACTAFIVQLPLPRHIEADKVISLIDPAKDADGLHPANLGRLVLAVDSAPDCALPCTPRACIQLLERHGIELAGKHVVVIGRGITVGRSIGLLLTSRGVNATVTCCHTGTRNLAQLTRQADVIVAAAGVAGLVSADMVKPGAAVLDVGVSRVAAPSPGGKARLEGDVADGVDRVAGWLSPNPQGVGPMTRALLLVNVVEAAKRAMR